MSISSEIATNKHKIIKKEKYRAKTEKKKLDLTFLLDTNSEISNHFYYQRYLYIFLI